MGGGIIQLVAVGAQDSKLIGNPKTNFFKSVYSHYYNFSMESIQQYFKGGTDFNKNCTVNIKRVGDLITKCYLECTIDNLCYGFPTDINCVTNYQSTGGKITDCLARFTSNLATAIIDKVEFKIGGQIIDTHTGTWMETWNELSASNNSLSFPYYGQVDCLRDIKIKNPKAETSCSYANVKNSYFNCEDCPFTHLKITDPEFWVCIGIYSNNLSKCEVCLILDIIYKKLQKLSINFPEFFSSRVDSTVLFDIDSKLNNSNDYTDICKSIIKLSGNDDIDVLENLYFFFSIVRIINGYSCVNACLSEEEQIDNLVRTLNIFRLYCKSSGKSSACIKFESFLTSGLYFLKQFLTDFSTLYGYILYLLQLEQSDSSEEANYILKLVVCMFDIQNCNIGCTCCLDGKETNFPDTTSPKTGNSFELDRGNIYIADNKSDFTYLTAGVGGGFVQALDNFQLCRMKMDALRRYWSLKTPFYIPFNFWFNRDLGSALPIIALQYHEVAFDIKFQDYKFIGNNKYGTSSKTKPRLNACLWVDYIFLDIDLRRKFAQEKHEYIIDQVQYNEFSGGNNNLELNFNHPIKFLTWIGSPFKVPMNQQGYEFISIGPSTPTSFIKQFGESHIEYTDVNKYMCKLKNISKVQVGLKMNGHDRFQPRCARYFTNKTTNDQQITGSPYIFLNRDMNLNMGVNSVTNNTLVTPINDSYGIGFYPFCLPGYALGLTPAGTCNFSRLDSVELNFCNPEDSSFIVGPIIVYAMNYNFLRIESGMGGLEFSN